MAPEWRQVEVEFWIPRNAWLIWLVGGALSAITGMWLLLNPNTTIGILAVLFGLGLLFNGLADLALAGDHPVPLLGYAMSLLFVVAGLIVVFNHSAGRATLAAVVGLSILITGIGDLVVAAMARERIAHWTFVAFLGAVGVLVGLLSLAWPTVTLLVLAVLVGSRFLVFGLVHMGIGLRLRELTAR